MTQYWVRRGGVRLGPFDEARIFDDYAQGTLAATDELWTEGMAIWVPVVDVFAELHAAVAHPDDLALVPAPLPEPAPASRAAAAPRPRPSTGAARATPDSTPAGRLAYAGFWVRWCAAAVDAIIVSVFCLLILLASLIASLVALEQPSGRFAAAGLLLGLATAWLYFAALESGPHRATFGKRMFSLEVRRAEGLGRIGFGQASARWVGRWLSWLPLALGYLVQPVTRRKQALHDLLSGTVVVSTAPVPKTLLVVLSVAFVLVAAVPIGGFAFGAAQRAIEMFWR